MRLSNRTTIHILVLAMSAMWSACTSDSLSLPEPEQPLAGEDMTGEIVQFETQVSSDKSGNTRAGYTVNSALLSKYAAISDDYKLTVTRYVRPIGSVDEGTADGEKTFLPHKTIEGTNVTYDAEGTLVLEETDTPQVPFYWDSNAKEYAFKAVGGSDEVARDQTTREAWLLQDRLEGYAYSPLMDGENPIDRLDAPNFRTSKQWYAMNKAWREQEGLHSTEDLKKISLFLQHKRSWITVILKAGEGMDRSNLDYSTADRRIAAKIFDGQSSETTNAVAPLLDKYPMVYDQDTPNQEARDVARYDAIVSPYNYLAKAEDDKICEISVSGQRFTFGASNDDSYRKYIEGVSAAAEKMQVYDLKAGQHLVITAVLSRESRKIMITAYVADWNEEVISYICDDYGSSGDPTVIYNRNELLAFLSDPEKNVAGNMAIIASPNINLEEKIVVDSEGKPTGESTPEDWPGEGLELKGTLNMGGANLQTAHVFLQSISTTGGIINGTFEVAANKEIPAAVCNENNGSVNRVAVVGRPGKLETDKEGLVNRAAIAVTNHGTITMCRSNINVEGKDVSGETTTYIGGIAAESYSSDESSLAIIEDCEVYGRVGIAANQTTVRGGGIVGLADGNVVRNTYEYGVTLLQNPTNDVVLRNIIYDKKSGSNNLEAHDNVWPTAVKNDIGEHSSRNANVRDIANLYDHVIDCQAELARLVGQQSEYNVSGKRYRISNDFVVSGMEGGGDDAATNWPLKDNSDDATANLFGNVLFELDGDNHKITLKGNRTIHYKAKKEDAQDIETFGSAPMLFLNIMGTIQNLDLYCVNSLYGDPVYSTQGGSNQSLDICAPLGYNLNGGTLSNVRVYGAKNTKVQGAIASGLVVWAFNGAVIENCVSTMDVQLYFSSDFGIEARRYGGGIVANAADATITMCSYYPSSNTTLSTTKKDSEVVFLGGIVGGVNIKSIDSHPGNNPALTITDCSSWYSWENKTNEVINNKRGGIIGRCGYNPTGEGAPIIGVMTSQCTGNWWSEGIAGVGEYLTGYNTDAKVIGTKNSVTPTVPTIEK